jgi:hypothetical protein
MTLYQVLLVWHLVFFFSPTKEELVFTVLHSVSICHRVNTISQMRGVALMLTSLHSHYLGYVYSHASRGMLLCEECDRDSPRLLLDVWGKMCIKGLHQLWLKSDGQSQDGQYQRCVCCALTRYRVSLVYIRRPL